jgi:hypothetical protein
VKQAAPVIAPRYRSRPVEVQALDCGDGRHVLLTDPPRFMPTSDFEAAFELVEERRAVERRRTNGKPAAKVERRKASRRQAEAKIRTVSPERVKARELWDANNGVTAISKAVGKPASLIYYWKKVDKWLERAPVVDQGKDTGFMRRCEECGARTTFERCPKGHQVG